MHERPKRGRHPGAGRRPAGPDGQPRNALLACKVAPTELTEILALAKRRGFTPDPPGVRALLLTLAADRDDQADQPQAA